jgi:nitroimidazol reductase NimA-like FMN-containing flavoprotein (pyridoxamine 5'-phosphate oxidase superfamily)
MNPNSTLPKHQLEELLRKQPSAALATINPDGSPYVVPVHFVVVDGTPYIHCGNHGQKLQNIQVRPQVSLTVWAEHGQTNAQDPSPCKTGTAYECAVFAGTASIVTEPTLKHKALAAFAQKYAAEKDVAAMSDTAEAATCVLALDGTFTVHGQPGGSLMSRHT